MRNPNIEIRNNIKIRISNDQNFTDSYAIFIKVFENVICFEFRIWNIRICFEFRVSNFEFIKNKLTKKICYFTSLSMKMT